MAWACCLGSCRFTIRKKPEEYLPHMKKMLDTVLEKGTNEDGIMYDQISDRTGRLSDGWGYNYVAYLCL